MGRITGKFDAKDIAFSFYWCYNRRCKVCPLREIDPNKVRCKNFIIHEASHFLEGYSNFLSLNNEYDKLKDIEELRHCFKWCFGECNKGNCEKCKWRGSDICFNLIPNITNALMDYVEEIK